MVNDENLFQNFLIDLSRDSSFKEFLDTDKSGKIDENELKDFINTIKANDGDSKNVSLEDVLKAAQDMQDGKFEIKQSEKTEETKQETKTQYSPNFAKAAVEWARKYLGWGQGDMQNVFAQLGHQFDWDAWCADFVKMSLYEAVGEENLPDWYKNCSNKAYCPTLQQYGEGHQVSAEEAQTGDIVLYDFDGDGSADHVGLFVDNGDGSSTITAIEGNTSGTSGSCVAEKARDRSTVLGIYSIH